MRVHRLLPQHGGHSRVHGAGPGCGQVGTDSLIVNVHVINNNNNTDDDNDNAFIYIAQPLLSFLCALTILVVTSDREVLESCDTEGLKSRAQRL